MIGLIQRVKGASVSVNSQIISEIEQGILLFLGIEKDDDSACVKKLARKIANIRIFEDDDGKMNKSLQEINGQLLVVSQFTLVANIQKGNRPGFSDSATPELGKSLYEEFVEHYSSQYGDCQCGQFGANMQVALINDGPATFHIQI